MFSKIKALKNIAKLALISGFCMTFASYASPQVETTPTVENTLKVALFTANFNPVSGSVDTKRLASNDSTKPITFPSATWTGYDFAGWDSNGDGKKDYDGGKSYTLPVKNGSNPVYNATLTALYTPHPYMITEQYRLQNADGSYGAYQSIIKQTYPYLSTVPAWSRAQDDTYQTASIPSFTVPANEVTKQVDVKRRVATNKVQFRYQNADGNYDSYQSGWSGDLRVGESHTWSIAQDSIYKATSGTVTGTASGATTSVDVDRNTYKINYTLDGGSYGPSYPTSYRAEQSVSISNPSRGGYTFTGWSSNVSGVSGTNLSFSGKTQNISLKAEWGGYVHWDKNGHGTAIADAFYSAGDTITLPTESDNDYDFLGWFTDPTNGTQVTTGTKFNGEVRYYAHWKQKFNMSLIYDHGKWNPNITSHWWECETHYNSVNFNAPKDQSYIVEYQDHIYWHGNSIRQENSRERMTDYEGYVILHYNGSTKEIWRGRGDASSSGNLYTISY